MDLFYDADSWLSNNAYRLDTIVEIHAVCRNYNYYRAIMCKNIANQQ